MTTFSGFPALTESAREPQPRMSAAAAKSGGAARYPVFRAPVAQRTERRPSKPLVGGSNPPRRIEGSNRGEGELTSAMGIVISLILIAFGAILTWAVNSNGGSVDPQVVGVILMVIGLVVFMISLV